MKKILFVSTIFSLAFFVQSVSAAEYALEQSEWTQLNGALNEEMGKSIAVAGDVNGDGFDDFLIGAPENDDGGSNAGLVYLILGSSAGITSDALSTAITFTGSSAGDKVGTSVASAGDVNGDGFDDFLIGAQGRSSSKGAAYLVYGRQSFASLTLGTSFILNTFARFDGEVATDLAGFAVSGAGDVNGDGFDDFLVGAYGNDAGGSSSGAVYLVYGREGNYNSAVDLATTPIKFIGEAGGDFAGSSLGAAGDVNGDGFDDFLVGANGNDDAGSAAGAVYLVYGQSSALSDDDIDAVGAQFSGETAGDGAGTAISGAGDVNGDGYADFLIGAGNNADGGFTNAGAAYLFYGQSTEYTLHSLATGVQFTGEGEDYYAGSSVSGAGDVNGDGFDDFLVGSIGNTDGGGTNAGAVYVVYGDDTSLSSTSLSTELQLTAEEAGDRVGYAATIAAGNLNGDGYSDIIVGAYSSDAGGTDSGAVSVLEPAAPTVTLSGNASVTHACGTAYSDAGATAVENYSNTALDVITTGSVDTILEGAQTVMYTSAQNLFHITGTATRTVTVDECEADVRTNGKYIRVFFGDTEIDEVKVNKKKVKKKYRSLVTSHIYQNKSYTNAVFVSAGKKKAKLIVFRITEDGELKKKVVKKFAILKRTPVKIKVKKKKKYIVTTVGKKAKKIQYTWKLTKKGKLKMVK